MGGAAKIREASKMQECKINHFMVRQRGQSDTGKVKTGQQSMKFDSFSDKTSTSQTCCCSCRRVWALDLMKLDIEGLWFDTGVQSCTCSIPRVGSCPKHHPHSFCHPSCASRAGGAGGAHIVPAGRAAVGTPGTSASQQEPLAAPTRPGQEW